MNLGSIVTAPSGHHALLQGIDYHLLANSSSTSLVVLAWFSRSDAASKTSDLWRADLIRLPRSEFESGIEAGSIIARNNDRAYPPWLHQLESLDPEALEGLRVSRKQSYRDYASNRYQHIAGLVDRRDDFFSAENMDAELARYAVACKPQQRTARVRLWLCAYLAFGEYLYALSPSFRGNGAWDRTRLADPNKKLGRPNRRNGTNSGYSAIPLIQRIVDSYLKRAELGKPMRAIYADAMTRDFGCKTTSSGDHIYQPNGEPFPSSDQFSYHVKKQLGLATVQREKYGDARYRNKWARDKGKFSAATGNVMETVEADANYLRERPRQLLSDKPGDPLATCRLICQATGYAAGVGFSYGAEREEAYKAALFFSAAPKALLSRLFGLEITDDDFPCSGIPRKWITDRGSGYNAVGEMHANDAPAIRDMSPSWMGQSKASSESSHPRHTKLEGAPVYIQSDLTVFELAKREILRAAADNRKKDCAARLTPEMIAARVPANPNGMVRYLANRGRVDTVTIPLERAIRCFLNQVWFTLDATGLWFYELRYASEQFDSCRLAERPRGTQQIRVPGYVAPMSVRLAWVECEGQLIEVSAQLPIRDDPQQLYLSVNELAELDLKRKELEAAQRAAKTAADIAARDRFNEATGKHWDAGTLKSGRPPARGAGRGRADVVPTQSKQQHARR